ncbi:dihydroflavonol-4-reductase [Lindgomyces ingoldianus]|uniref:Dihydroflavonol-4-reductase n=1 Tax=Lindgomyces ingoldianus TaxID=673940 RepID=A0ACB6R274_9PLEO|nr:dihydroflavonol-4-reductase [Lindgomyces ingoldianus]KAF2473354.1 dihydroflavonol-4-reductase [Lindgomyces ingoldianus]
MPTLALNPDSLVFVTGVNGLIGSHIADQLLERGYHVRGAVRDVAKASWLSDYFTNKHKNAKFELVSVPDMTLDGCYDDVVKDCDGFVHVASPLTGQIPEETIPIAIKGGLNALKAAAKNPSIKRVVYTSSSIAATMPRPNTDFSVDETSYNEVAVKKVWNHPEDEPESFKGLYMYAAIKTETEMAMWKWVREEKPGFVFNSILPNANFSRVLVPEKQGFPSTIAWAHAVFTGENFDAITHIIPPQWFIDTIDDALLHIAALIYSDVDSERLFGFAEPFNWNQILAIYRKSYPERKFRDDIEGLGEDRMKMPRERAEELLKWMGREGWTGLEESVGEMCKDFVKDEEKKSPEK